MSGADRPPGDQPDEALVEAIQQRQQEAGGLPRVALFLFDVPDAGVLRSTLERIPRVADDWLEEIVVMQQRVSGPSIPEPARLVGDRKLELRIHRPPRDSGYGRVRKAAFEYALRRGLDHVVFMRGDGLHPPEALCSLVHSAVMGAPRLVIASRLVRRRDMLRSWVPVARLAAHTLATGFQNRVLGLRLTDYHSGFRLYPVRDVERVPFQLNADDRSFDMQIVIQLRALGAAIDEVPVQPVWQEYATGREGLFEVLRACASAVDYRLHQLHFTRRGPFFVDPAIHYTLKRSKAGSHMQIVDAIRPGTEVLDLGCSQGLLARPLREKDVRVTGVDAGPPERLADELAEYFQRDLEHPLELPTGRRFDYVVSSDVIEHIRNRAQLLRSARRFLNEHGRLIISTPNVALWFYRLSLLVGRFEYGPRGVLDEDHVHLFTGSTFRREVQGAGFHIRRQRVTALPFEVVFQSTGRSRLIRSIERLYHLAARLWPSMFAYQYILEAEITTLDEDSTAP